MQPTHRSKPRALAGCAAALGAALAFAATAQASFTQEPGSPFAVGANPYGVLVSDFNADNRPDVVAINGTSSTASVLLRQPAGGFAQETGSPISVGGGPNFGAVADFNGDNRPDFAVANYVGGTVSVLLRLPGGGFVTEGAPAAPKATAVAAADFNADGRPDLAVTNYAGTVTILLRKLGGGFTAEPAVPAGVLPRNIATADFNGDGRPDLAVTNYGGANVTILLRKASGGFEQDVGSPVAVGPSPAGIVAADFNSDGRPDLAVANFGSDTVSLLLRQAGGGFVAGQAVTVGVHPLGVATADFNRDGLPDLVTTNNNGPASAVTILLGREGGGYAPDPSSPVPTASGAYGVGIADFDADGRADLAVSNDGSSNVTILLNSTPGPTPLTPVMKPPPTAPITTATPPPIITPPPPPAINVRLILSWTVTERAVTLNSALVRDVPVGATVRLVCGRCTGNQTVTAKRAGGVTLSKLRGRKFRRGDAFSLTITKPGYVGQALTRTVKRYGRTDKAIRQAARGPFSEIRRCVPAGTTKPADRC
jgi:hypothetical protein